ncbi:MAG TPA: pitrilysin family protein [Candidatus Acidoferrales bacterium]|nr:pitrilysin family protein [Candidatus Acidoferrales bacterium]
MKRYRVFSMVGLALAQGIAGVMVGATPPRATPAADATAASQGVHIPVEQYTLKNGLRVVLSEDHAAPTISLCLTYDVGSRNELPGHTGFAHLFEHMMFQGSENVGKGEHLIMVHVNGGDVNGTTTDDSTNYYERVPANQLDMALFLESDRMKALRITQANLDNQRSTVQEERRLRMDNQPYGKTNEIIEGLTYDNFAYKHSTMGSMEDLNAASLADVAQFFKTYYAPNNAVLTLVGDFKSPEALAKIKKYFEEIPQQPAPPSVDMTEPAQTAERRTSVDDSFARLPRLDIVYKTVPANTADFYALDMLGDILFSGPSSRMYQKLVKEKMLALNVAGGMDLRRGPALFQAFALLKPGQNSTDVEKLIYDEIERVKKDGVTPEEMRKILIQDRLQQAESMTSTMSRARTLGQYAVYFHDPDLINTILAKYSEVTPADIQHVAREYLGDAQRTVVITTPKAPSKPGA